MCVRVKEMLLLLELLGKTVDAGKAVGRAARSGLGLPGKRNAVSAKPKRVST